MYCCAMFGTTMLLLTHVRNPSPYWSFVDPHMRISGSQHRRAEPQAVGVLVSLQCDVVYGRAHNNLVQEAVTLTTISVDPCTITASRVAHVICICLPSFAS